MFVYFLRCWVQPLSPWLSQVNWALSVLSTFFYFDFFLSFPLLLQSLYTATFPVKLCNSFSTLYFSFFFYSNFLSKQGTLFFFISLSYIHFKMFIFHLSDIVFFLKPISFYPHFFFNPLISFSFFFIILFLLS